MKTLPHVSQILKIMEDAYADIPPKILDMATSRGSALHAIACTYMASLQGLCGEPEDIPPQYVPGYAGFQNWVKVRNVKPILVEEVSITDDYCGTPDAKVEMEIHFINGKAPFRGLVLPDWKFTASVIRLNHVQVMAYMRLKDYLDAQYGMILHINSLTGEWIEHEVKPNPRDLVAFKSAINIWNWRHA